MLRTANYPRQFGGAPLACRVEPFEVLPQQVLAVVVAVRRADHDVDVELLRLVVVQEHALVHVKLDEQHGTVHLVIKHVVVAKATHPGEPGLRQVLLDLLQPHLVMAWPQMAGIRLDKVSKVALAWGQGIGTDALVRDDDVVLERHRLLAPIRRV